MAEVAVRMREVSRSDHARYARDIHEMISAMDDVVSRVDRIVLDVATSEPVRDTIKASCISNECVGYLNIKSRAIAGRAARCR